jgi:hypothetical protein
MIVDSLVDVDVNMDLDLDVDIAMNLDIDVNDDLESEADWALFSDPNECAVCLGEHDEELHAAVARVRHWFCERVTQSFRIHHPECELAALSEVPESTGC